MKSLVLVWLMYGCVGAALAQERPEVLPSSCEVELALSAAPEHLRAESTVFVLKDQGYEMTHEGTNGFVCIVNRDHPKSLKPTCFDEEGGMTIVPKILKRGSMLMAGKTQNEIQDAIAQGFSEGAYISPRRPGVAYMLSRFNRPVNPSTGQVGSFPPHVMFYAPGLTNQDIGFDRSTYAQGLPFVAYQGKHGYMIMLAEEAGSSMDLPACKGILE